LHIASEHAAARRWWFVANFFLMFAECTGRMFGTVGMIAMGALIYEGCGEHAGVLCNKPGEVFELSIFGVDIGSDPEMTGWGVFAFIVGVVRPLLGRSRILELMSHPLLFRRRLAAAGVVGRRCGSPLCARADADGLAAAEPAGQLQRLSRRGGARPVGRVPPRLPPPLPRDGHLRRRSLPGVPEPIARARAALSPTSQARPAGRA